MAASILTPRLNLVEPISANGMSITAGSGVPLHVDKLNSRIGIGTTSPSLVGHINGASVSFPATSGSSQTGILRISQDVGTAVLDFGNNGAQGSWLQSTRSDDLSINDPLLLNPNGGNVGIGTTSPNISGNQIAATISTGGTTGTATYEMLGTRTSDGAVGGVEWINSSASNARLCIIDGERHDANNSGRLNFLTMNAGSITSKMVIDPDGSVGIGTTSPDARLNVENSVSGFDVNGFSLISNTNSTNGDYAGTGYRTHDNSGDGNIKSWFGVYRHSTFGRGDFIWLLDAAADNNAAGTGDEVMRLTNDGKLGIGTDTPGTLLEMASSGGAILTINAGTGQVASVIWEENSSQQWELQHSPGTGRIEMYDYSDSSVATYVAPGGTDWTATSDARLKTDIIDIGPTLDLVNQIPVRKYRWKDSGKVDYGFIAQELIDIIPNSVVGSPEDDVEIAPMGVTKVSLIPFLTKAIQELKAEIDELKAGL